MDADHQSDRHRAVTAAAPEPGQRDLDMDAPGGLFADGKVHERLLGADEPTRQTLSDVNTLILLGFTGISVKSPRSDLLIGRLRGTRPAPIFRPLSSHLR
jgi:hypothetical protein